MTEQQNLAKDIQSCNEIIRQNVVHSVFSCPKGNNCKDKGRFTFEKGSGFTNTYRHLITCIQGGDESLLLQIYYNTLAENRSRSTISEQFSRNPSIPIAKSKENTIYAYLKLIVLNHYPISHHCRKKL